MKIMLLLYDIYVIIVTWASGLAGYDFSIFSHFFDGKIDEYLREKYVIAWHDNDYFSA